MTNNCIVLASEFWFGASAEGLAHGLRKLGWDVCPIDTFDHFLQSRFLSLRLLSRVGRRFSIASYNAAILDAVDEIKPKVFLTVKGNYITSATLEALSRKGIVTINYYTDFHFDHPGVDQHTFPLFSHFFTTKSFQLPFLQERLGPERVTFLHHGYSSLVHRPRVDRIDEDDYVADILYAGNHSAYKARWLEAIAVASPGVKLLIVGGRWKEATKETVLAPFVLGHALHGDAFSRIIQQARINVAFHLGPLSPKGWQDLVSTRTFEIPACKGFMLHIDNSEVRALYEPGEEIDVFSTEKQLCEKIGHYLSRPQLRQDMIERAFSRCVPAYSYDARAAEMMEHIKPLLA